MYVIAKVALMPTLPLPVAELSVACRLERSVIPMFSVRSQWSVAAPMSAADDSRPHATKGDVLSSLATAAVAAPTSTAVLSSEAPRAAAEPAWPPHDVKLTTTRAASGKRMMETLTLASECTPLHATLVSAVVPVEKLMLESAKLAMRVTENSTTSPGSAMEPGTNTEPRGIRPE